MRLIPLKDDIIRDAVNSTKSMTAAAKKLSTPDAPVTSQQVKQWIGRMDTTELQEGYDKAKELARSRNFQSENTSLRARERALADAVGTKDELFFAIERLVDELPRREPVDYKAFIGAQAGTGMTVEALLSDLQIGKLGPDYNTGIAKRRLFEYGKALRFQIEQKMAVGYRIEEVVLALLGDIIESDKKHKNSARATDTGTAEQMFDATSGIFELVIEPLAKLGIPVRVVCIAGNHDWDDHGMAMFRPGKEMLSYPLYRSLEYITRRSGYANVRFIIPEGAYAVEEIYGQHVLYEHGVGVAAAETAMKSHKVKRSEQEKRHITYFRMGDKHTVTEFNSRQLVVNGAFFGAKAGGTEYSGIAGYSSVASQWVGFHVRRDDSRLSIYDAFVIQLEHIR